MRPRRAFAWKSIPSPKRSTGSSGASFSSRSSRWRSRKRRTKASKGRLTTLRQTLAALEKEYADLEEIWKAEKASLQGAAQIKEKLEGARLELEQARRASDLSRMAELQYGRIPELEKQLAQAQRVEQTTPQLVRNSVTEEEIAQVVSKWTGIPVSRMLEGEKEKLLRMEEALEKRVVGQQEAVRIVSNAIRRVRAPAFRIRGGRTARSCSWARPESARPSCARPWRSFCSTPKRPWCELICPSSWRSTRSLV
jgi:vacuolar-type H+-ATPase subunit I/STV1